MSDYNERTQINASGFPFQIRVEHEIRSRYSEHRWRVSAVEHKWKNKATGQEGFIDIIVEKNPVLGISHYLIIECKRMKMGGCVFLNGPEDSEEHRAILLDFRKSHNGEEHPCWRKYDPDPRSLIATFCTVPGQHDKQTPMLERICDSLLDSAESLADEMFSKAPKPQPGSLGIKSLFIPAIVVNTELKSCAIDPKDITLDEGELKDGHGALASAPYIRFQKNFGTRYNSLDNAVDLKDINKANQRTVFVVNAGSLVTFLARWEID